MEEQKTALHKDILVGGSLTSIKRQAKQNATTLGVSLVVLGPRWRPPWPRMRDMLILDLDEVGETKKTFCIGICKWE